ncbi:hypothetical protein B0H12DRAFT_1074727 [Mycena haematopus]|nr:hypothetical protein B0H12DRAFT_1074727 [Mycena haematopus]
MAVDLLRNRNANVSLGSFDGRVGAIAHLGAEHYFITTHADYIPALPSLKIPHALFLRSDMRYGTDDPTLWPQEWEARYCHFPAIARRGTRSELNIMWWDPGPQDFIHGTAITKGLGTLSTQRVTQLLKPINALVARLLIQNIGVRIELLQDVPTTYTKMVFGVTSLQRAFLELDALYNYMTIYKPRIDNYMICKSTSAPIADCVGAFTSVPAIAQQLWSARLPCWLLRPTHTFSKENILAVVPLKQPTGIAEDIPGTTAPRPVYSGNHTLEKIAAIQREAETNPWYYDPFDTHPPRSLSPSPALQSSVAIPVASGSRTIPPVDNSSASSSQQVARAQNKQQPRFKPYPAKPPGKAPATQVSKTDRDKFAVLSIPEMPPSIDAWAAALAQVDRSVAPVGAVEKRYVLPEPALLVNTTYERRRLWLHHWSLLCDGFLYMLSQPDHARPFSNQEWRDVLAGLLTKHGHPNSKAYKRSAQLEELLRPVWQASGLTSIEGFPAPIESLPHFSLEQTHEIVWRVAEISFRFELRSLDKRASKKDRLEQVKGCFAGHRLLGVPLELSKRGWAATAIEERHRYVARTATLMLDWTTQCPRPSIIHRVADRRNWSLHDMQVLETAVCQYYTQSFWEYFGRAAVVPLRLNHDVEKEEGQL